MRAPWTALTRVLTAPVGALGPDGASVGEAWVETAARLDLVRLGWFDSRREARLRLEYPCERAVLRTLDPRWARAFGLGIDGAVAGEPMLVTKSEGGAVRSVAVAEGDGLLVAGANRDAMPTRAVFTELGAMAAALARRIELEQRLEYGERIVRSARRVAAAGHDLRNEMTRALLAAKSAKANPDELDSALRAARSLVGDAIAPHDTQPLESNLGVMRLRSLVVDEVRSAAASARVPAGRMPRIRVKCDDERMARIELRAFRRLVRNVVTNALEATARRHATGASDEGLVTVEVRPIPKDRFGHAVVLRVEDDGDGFRAQALRNYLEPRIERDATDSTGLGTASLRESLEACRAPLKVVSTPGRGTRVEVALLQ